MTARCDHPTMRRITIIIAAFALTAAGCSSGDDDADSSDDGATTTQAAPDDADSGDGQPTPGTDDPTSEGSDGPITIWLPSSLALDSFVEAAVADAPYEVTVIEEPATYSETADAARAALDAGSLVIVPATIGQQLVDDAGAELHTRIFEDDDPEAAATQLGVWLLGAPGTPTGATIENAGAPRGSNGPFVMTALRRTPALDAPAQQSTVAEVGDFVVEEAKALDDSVRQGKAFEAAGVVVESAATTYGTRVGGSVVARTVAKAAGPVAVVLDFLKTMHDFTVAAMETIDADSNARISLYDTGLAATAMISTATVKLAELEAAINAGQVSRDEAQELIDAMQNSITRASNVAVETAFELGEAGDEANGAQVDQLRERQLGRFFKQLADTIDANDRVPATPPVVVNPVVDRIIDPTAITVDQSAAVGSLLFPTKTGNESMHSNGRQTAVSAGETDITAIGQVWWMPSDGGPGLDSLLPCGDDGGSLTVCGGRSYTGNYTVAVAELGGPLDFASDKIYQYAFIFDRDGDPGDNYVAGGSYPYDTWDQSDIRYEFWHNGNGSGLSVTEGPNFSAVDTGARFHVEGNTVMAIIPDDEISGGPYDPLVPMRATSFWHLGDYGEGPDQAFNIDLFPVVHDPYWMPSEAVQLMGPGGGLATPAPDQATVDSFDAYVTALGSRFEGLMMTEPAPEDTAALESTDECFANAFFSDNPTVVLSQRSDYEADGTSIQVRSEAHDSEAAARGAFGFSGNPVSVNCRAALVDSVGVELIGVERTVETDTLTVDRYELGDGADDLFINVYSAWDGMHFTRINTTGFTDDALHDLIIDALTP